MKSKVPVIFSLCIIGIYLLISGILILEPYWNPGKNVTWSTKDSVVTIIAYLLGSASTFFFYAPKEDLFLRRVRVISGGFIILFYTICLAFTLLYPSFYFDDGPDKVEHRRYAANFATIVVPGTLLAALALAFPKKSIRTPS